MVTATALAQARAVCIPVTGGETLFVFVILCLVALLILVSCAWQLISRSAVRHGATKVTARFDGFETSQAGFRKLTRYRFRFQWEGEEKTALSINAAFFGGKKPPKNQKVEILYNPQVKLYCAICGNHETEYSVLTGLASAAVLVALGLLIWLG